MNPLQWMGAVKTSDKNITSNDSSTSVNVLWSEKLHAWKNWYCRNGCFLLKYESSNYNIAFSSEKVNSSESGEKYAQILQKKTK